MTLRFMGPVIHRNLARSSENLNSEYAKWFWPSPDILTGEPWDPRRTFWDFAGHFMSVEKENLYRKFLTFIQRNVISSPDILRISPSPDKMSGEYLPLRQTFEMRPADFTYSEWKVDKSNLKSTYLVQSSRKLFQVCRTKCLASLQCSAGHFDPLSDIFLSWWPAILFSLAGHFPCIEPCPTKCPAMLEPSAGHVRHISRGLEFKTDPI